MQKFQPRSSAQGISPVVCVIKGDLMLVSIISFAPNLFLTVILQDCVFQMLTMCWTFEKLCFVYCWVIHANSLKYFSS